MSVPLFNPIVKSLEPEEAASVLDVLLDRLSGDSLERLIQTLSEPHTDISTSELLLLTVLRKERRRRGDNERTSR